MKRINNLFSSTSKFVGFLHYYALALIIEIPVAIYLFVRSSDIGYFHSITLPRNLLLGIMGLFLALEILNLFGTIVKGYPFLGLMPIVCVSSLTVAFQIPSEVVNQYLFPFWTAVVIFHTAQWVIVKVRACRKMPVPPLQFSTPDGLVQMSIGCDVVGSIALVGEFLYKLI